MNAHGRNKVYAREELSGSWRYYEGDEDGWLHRQVSLRADWSVSDAWGTAELRPNSADRWFGRITLDDMGEWLRRPNVEPVTASMFEEIWSLARGALGQPVELQPHAG